MGDNLPYNNDEFLLAQVAEGNEQAFFHLYDKYSSLLNTFLRKYTPSDADREEIIQETFIRVWLNRTQLVEIENFRSWIYKVSSRVFINYITRQLNEKNRIATHISSATAINAATPYHEVYVKELKGIIKQAVDKLTLQKKTVFSMNRVEGKKPAQIATELRMPLSTVKNQLSAALKEVREHLTDSGYGPLAILYAITKNL